jgi:hypothetical protein
MDPTEAADLIIEKFGRELLIRIGECACPGEISDGTWEKVPMSIIRNEVERNLTIQLDPQGWSVWRD